MNTEQAIRERLSVLKPVTLELNDEMNVAVSDRGLAARLLEDFKEDLRRAKKLDPAEWRRRFFLEKVREHFWSYFGEIF